MGKVSSATDWDQVLDQDESTELRPAFCLIASMHMKTHFKSIMELSHCNMLQDIFIPS